MTEQPRDTSQLRRMADQAREQADAMRVRARLATASQPRKRPPTWGDAAGAFALVFTCICLALIILVAFGYSPFGIAP